MAREALLKLHVTLTNAVERSLSVTTGKPNECKLTRAAVTSGNVIPEPPVPLPGLGTPGTLW